jgi:geranylgeranyl diphosphate synthase type I
MEAKSQKVLQRFGRVITEGVSHPELLSILNYLRGYWKEILRPALTCFSCEAVGGSMETAEDAGLMLTLAAAGTQIHDEIIDKSSRNFFRKTIYGSRGIDAALLAGDLLIVKAWTMLRNMINKPQKPSRISRIINMYGLISIEICEAELMETAFRRKLETNLKDHEKNFLWKINADLEACSTAGAILGGGSEFEIQTMADVGRRLGFMMGLRDDVIDSLNLKNNLSHRLEFESIPLPILYAAKSTDEKYFRIKSILESSFPLKSSNVEELVEICFDANAYAYVKDVANRNAEIAYRSLEKLERSTARCCLELLVKKFLSDTEYMHL